ncbi:MAG TPA: DsrE family protein [Bacteroidia bacterium]|nr:DsrE family protein [Bacteroidia bacterium]
MKKITLFLFACLIAIIGNSQTHGADSTIRVLQFKQDSTLHALIHADSVKIQKEYAKKIRWEKLKAGKIYPVINAGDGSGVVPVKDPTEIPDPNMDYKLLFELTASNPDSVASELNYGLVEIARIINLHVASGVPLKKIHIVIVAHGFGLNVLTSNAYYKEHFKRENPNLKLINQLAALDARFIACGQALAYFNVNKEALLPNVKVSLTAQTVLSSYALKGYMRY